MDAECSVRSAEQSITITISISIIIPILIPIDPHATSPPTRPYPRMHAHRVASCKKPPLWIHTNLPLSARPARSNGLPQPYPNRSLTPVCFVQHPIPLVASHLLCSATKLPVTQPASSATLSFQHQRQLLFSTHSLASVAETRITKHTLGLLTYPFLYFTCISCDVQISTRR